MLFPAARGCQPASVKPSTVNDKTRSPFKISSIKTMSRTGAGSGRSKRSPFPSPEAEAAGAENWPSKSLPSSVRARFTKKIEDVVPLADFHLLVFFRDGLVKKCDIREFFRQNKQLKVFLELHKEMFYHVRIQNGGYGVYWEENMSIADFELYKTGEKVPLSLSDFRNFVTHRVINTAEAAEILNCSRQNIDDLVRRDRLYPIKTSNKNKMFLKSEILKRNWE